MIITPPSVSKKTEVVPSPPPRRTGLITLIILSLGILAVRLWKDEPDISSTTAPTPQPEQLAPQIVTNIPVDISSESIVTSPPAALPNEAPITTHQKEINEMFERNMHLETIRNDQWNSMREEIIENSTLPPEERSPLAPTENDLLNLQANPTLISG